VEQVAQELVVRGLGPMALEMRLAAGRKLRLVGLDSAMGAGEDQHGASAMQ
jgi:hypothetical protein